MWYQVHLTTERNQTHKLQVNDMVSSTPYHRKESNTNQPQVTDVTSSTPYHRKESNQLQVTDVVSSTPYHRKESNTQTLVVIGTDYYIQDVNLTTI